MAESWDFPRGTSGVRVLLEVGAARGLDATLLLAGTGLRPSDLDDPEGVVWAGQELAVVRALVRATGDAPGCGAAAGSALRLGMLGIFGYVMLLSPTLGEAFAVAMRHGPGKLAWTFLRPEVVRDGREQRLIYAADELPADLRAFLTERDLACTAWMLRAIAGREISVRLDTGLDAARRAALAAAVPFAAVAAVADDAVAVDDRLLDLRLPYGDAASLPAQELMCERLADHRIRRTPAVARVRSALLRSAAWPSMEEVAAMLHVDERTLRRHLAAEGTSFQAVLDDSRRELAVELLRGTDLAIAVVARTAGYADTATFTRAFRRWTGTTPGSLRAHAE